MALKFKGGERLQRGRGIGGLLRLAKGLFSPIVKTVKRAITSKAAKATGKAIAKQLVESGANIASDALAGNDVNESFQRELQAGKQNAAIGIQDLKRTLHQNRTKQPPKKKKKVQCKSKFNKLVYK